MEFAMTALFVARIRVQDPDKMKAYSAAAAPTIAAHGGEILSRGQFAKAILGTAAAHATAIMRFPSVAAIERWFASPEYQALTTIRDAAGEAEFMAYEAP
jgi:uncharacterized protein (DUF1330 family)